MWLSASSAGNSKSWCGNQIPARSRKVWALFGVPSHTLLRRVSISWADEPEIEPIITILRLDSPWKDYSRFKAGPDVLFRPLCKPPHAESTLKANVYKNKITWQRKDENVSMITLHMWLHIWKYTPVDGYSSELFFHNSEAQISTVWPRGGELKSYFAAIIFWPPTFLIALN